MLNRNMLSTIFVPLILVLSCANELTPEQRNREESLRTYNRLMKAQGNFRGSVRIGDGATPIELSVTVLGNPTEGDKKPQIQSSLRIGLFGGVLLPSRGAAFDWGTGELTLSFGRLTGAGEQGSAGGSSLELTGTVTDAGIESARLIGSKQGTHLVTLERVETFTAPAAMESYYRVWDKRRENETAPHALLSIKKKPVDTLAPAGLDLPTLPGLDVAVRFEHLGQTPQTADALYDPLASTITLTFSPDSRMDLYAVASPITAPGVNPERMDGTIFMNGLEQYFLGFQLEPSTKPTISQLPPVGFRGAFSTGPESPHFKAVAYLQSTGGKITNGLEIPFRVFPEFRLTLFICDKGKSLATKKLRGITLHPLERLATFTASEAGFKNDLEVRFNQDWTELKGVFVSHKSGAGEEPQFDLKSDPTLGVDGCKE